MTASLMFIGGMTALIAVVVADEIRRDRNRTRRQQWLAQQARIRAQRDAIWARRDGTRTCDSCCIDIHPTQRAELDGRDANGNPAAVWFCPHCNYLNADTKPQPTTPRRGK